jgi:hypothetical protein
VTGARISRGNGRLPDEMQGRWIDIDDPDGQLVVDGFEVSYRGRAVRHDYFTVSHDEGALCVDLGIDATDDEAQDTFARENVTNLVLDPEGAFHAYNVKFASEFERAES